MRFRLAVVDEDSAVLGKLENHFKLRNYQISIYDDPVKFLNDLKRLHHKIILLSSETQKMPSLNLLSRIRKINPLIQIILTARDTGTDEVKQALTLGAVGVIEKPFDSLQAVEKEVEKSVQWLENKMQSSR